MTVQVQYNGTFSLHTLITPIRSGYRFDQWSETGAITVTADVTITASWIQLYTVNFDLNYTGAPEAPVSMTYASGDEYGALPVVSRNGFKFDGWYTGATDGAVVTADATVSASQTLYAHWLALYTVKFNFNYDGAPIVGTFGDKVYTEGDTYGTLPTVSRERFSFDGWYTAANNGTAVTADTAVSANQTLYAHWTQVEFVVIIDANGGTVNGSGKLVFYV